MGFKPGGAIGYVHLLPLSEIISTVLGVSYPGIRKVWDIYNSLTAKFGSEYAVLIDASEEEMLEIVDPRIAEAITRVREGKVDVFPGYDGVYGQLLIFPEQKEAISKITKVGQQSLADFV